MGEVWHFNECLIRTGTTTTRIDTFATGINVSLNITYNEIRDENGKVTKRVERSRDASMGIDSLYASEVDFTAGDNLRLLYANNLGTTTYQLGSAYISEKGWNQSEDAGVSHNVRIVGGDFGTIS